MAALPPIKPPRAALLELRLDEERCRRDGVGWLAPKSGWFAWGSDRSAWPAEVDEVLDTTDADC
jgi:hypothetical protein